MAEHRDTLSRQWLLLQNLPRAPARIKAGDLARRLEHAGHDISKRSVERDLQTLSAKFPIECDDRSRPYGWSWQRDASTFSMPGMSPLQAAVLLTADRHLRSLLPAHLLKELRPFMEQAKRALLPIGTAETPPWPERVAVAPERQQLLPPKLNDEVLVAVHEAIYRGRQLQATYSVRGSDAVKERTLHPLGLVVCGVVTYLACRIWKSEHVTTLALHRIKSAEVLDGKAVVPKGFKIADLVSEVAAGFDRGKPIKLVLKMDEDAAQHLLEAPLAADQTVTEPDKEGRITIEATVEHTAQLHWWLMGYGSNVEVLAPKRLRDALREGLEDALELYKPRMRKVVR